MICGSDPEQRFAIGNFSVPYPTLAAGWRHSLLKPPKAIYGIVFFFLTWKRRSVWIASKGETEIGSGPFITVQSAFADLGSRTGGVHWIPVRSTF